MRVVSYRILCDINKVEVLEVDYFRGRIAPVRFHRLELLCLSPLHRFCVNTLLCAVLTFSAGLPMAIGAQNMPPELVFLFWLVWFDFFYAALVTMSASSLAVSLSTR